MSAKHSNKPIFIHSLFRAGSTYLYDVFRRSSAGYWCYQEPLHEIALAAKADRSVLTVEQDLKKMILLRHPALERPYFYELSEVADQCLDELSAGAIYDAYFCSEAEQIGAKYLRSLCVAARGRPVIQECRTSSRIGAIKDSIGGTQIYLWRNPFDQWWSYQVAEYFPATTQLIINATKVPNVIERLRAEIAFQQITNDGPHKQFEWFERNRLKPDDSYLAFYILWMLGLIEGLRKADIVVSIDLLSNSEEYRTSILSQLAQFGIGSIDFATCEIPQASYGEEEIAAFERIENRAHGLLLLGGTSSDDIQRALAIRSDCMRQCAEFSRASVKTTRRDAERARTLAKTFDEVAYANRLECDARIRGLSTRNSELGSKLEIAQENAKQAQNEAERSRQMLQEAVDGAQKIGIEARRAYDEAAQVKLALQQAESEAQQARAETQRSQGEAVQTRLALQQAASEAQQARGEAQRSHDEAVQTKQALEQAANEVLQIRAEVQRARDEAIQSKLAEQHARTEMQRAIEDARQAVQAMQNAFSDTQMARAETNCALSDAQQAKQAMQHAISDAQVARVEKQSALDEARQANLAAQKANEDVQKERAERLSAATRYLQVVDLLKVAQNEIEQLRKRLSEAEQCQRQAEAKERMQQAQARLAEAESIAQLAQAEIRLEELRSAHALLRKELDSVRKELGDVHEANHWHWTQLQVANTELHEARRVNGENQEQLCEARLQLEMLAQQLNNVHHEMQDAHRANQALRDSMSWRATSPLRRLAAPVFARWKPKATKSRRRPEEL